MRRLRVGAIFLETCVAVFVVATALVAIAQLMILAARQGRAMDQERQAIAVAANLMERIMASPWDELTPEKLQPLRQSLESPTLPRTDVRIDVIEHPQPTAREIVVRVQWQRPSGSQGRPVQLSAWRYHHEAHAP